MGGGGGGGDFRGMLANAFQTVPLNRRSHYSALVLTTWTKQSPRSLNNNEKGEGEGIFEGSKGKETWRSV